MKSHLFNDLEVKIEAMLEEVELLRMEITELRETKQQLETEQQQTEARIEALLGKFSILEGSES